MAQILTNEGYEVEILGAQSDEIPYSYAEAGIEFANIYLNDKEHDDIKYIALCGSGIGISIALNRYKHIRAARVTNVNDAKLAKLHNNANILVMGGRITTTENAIEMFHEWEKTEFEGGRHIPRINKIDEIGEDIIL